MKYRLALLGSTYALDEQQNMHEIRGWIRGICGALATAIAFITARYLYDLVFSEISFLTILIGFIAFSLIYLLVFYICNAIIILLAKAGRKGYFENEG